MKLSLKLLAKVVSEEERKDIEESINKYEEAERLKENMIPVFRMKII